MSNDFEKVLQNIIFDSNLKKEIETLNSLDEIYKVFVREGYKDNIEKFEMAVSDLLERFSKNLSDVELGKVSGGFGNNKLNKIVSGALGTLMGVGAFSMPSASAKGHINSNTIQKMNIAKKSDENSKKNLRNIILTDLAVSATGIGLAMATAGIIYLATRNPKVNVENTKKELKEILNAYSNLIKDVDLYEISDSELQQRICSLKKVNARYRGHKGDLNEFLKPTCPKNKFIRECASLLYAAFDKSFAVVSNDVTSRYFISKAYTNIEKNLKSLDEISQLEEIKKTFENINRVIFSDRKILFNENIHNNTNLENFMKECSVDELEDFSESVNVEEHIFERQNSPISDIENNLDSLYEESTKDNSQDVVDDDFYSQHTLIASIISSDYDSSEESIEDDAQSAVSHELGKFEENNQDVDNFSDNTESKFFTKDDSNINLSSGIRKPISKNVWSRTKNGTLRKTIDPHIPNRDGGPQPMPVPDNFE